MSKEKLASLWDKNSKLIKGVLGTILILFFINKLGIEKSISIIKALFLLGVVIFVHELGHFLIAKATKVPVYKFAVGMGSKIVSKTIGGTEYSIRMIPLGGFVQLELEEELDSEEGSTFRKLSAGKRIAVYFAGALFNFILAFIVIMGIVFSMGYPSTTIGEVFDDSLAKKYGLQVGDSVLSINNKNVDEWEDIPKLIKKGKGEKLTFIVERDGTKQNIVIDMSSKSNSESEIVGIAPEYKKDLAKSISSGFKSTIVNIQSTVRGLFDAFTGIVEPLVDKIAPNDNSTQTDVESDVELTGPIGTINVISSQMNKGFLNYIMLMASISISLGVFNLLPIPGLDGGRIFLIIIEIIRGGKQLSIEQELKVTMIGVFSLLALMVITTFNDITNLF